MSEATLDLSLDISNCEPALSVVLPAARVDSSLFCCLEALARQTLSRELFELILVLDGVEAPHDFFSPLRPVPPLRVYSSPSNRGRSAARNTGIRHARGDLIVSLDADIVAGPELLRHYFEADSRLEAASIGDRKFVRPYPRMTAATESGFLEMLSRADPRADFRAPFYSKTDFLRNAAEPFWAFSTCNCSYPRTRAIAAGLFDETVKSWGLEDQELGYRLWKLGTRFRYLPAAVAVHIEHPRDVMAERQSWEENRRYFARRHGSVFHHPRASVLFPRLLSAQPRESLVPET